MTDLIVIEKINAVELFSGGDQLDDLLAKIEKDVTSVVPDLSTAKGRKAIASNAARIPSVKTALDDLGIEIVSGWKDKSKKVDAERKKMRDFLDALKAKARKPLTDWEDEEKKRIDFFESTIQEMKALGEGASKHWDINPIEGTIATLERLAGDFEIDESWDEYFTLATKTKSDAIELINQAICRREKYDAEQTELAKLRAESEQREKEKREEELRREGEENARLAVEKERQAAVDAKDLAERKAKEVEENAEQRIKEAAQIERNNIERQRLQEELATKDREADKKHKAKINRAAMDELFQLGLSEKKAKAVVIAIAKGHIPNVKINY